MRASEVTTRSFANTSKMSPHVFDVQLPVDLAIESLGNSQNENIKNLTTKVHFCWDPQQYNNPYWFPRSSGHQCYNFFVFHMTLCKPYLPTNRTCGKKTHGNSPLALVCFPWAFCRSLIFCFKKTWIHRSRWFGGIPYDLGEGHIRPCEIEKNTDRNHLPWSPWELTFLNQKTWKLATGARAITTWRDLCTNPKVFLSIPGKWAFRFTQIGVQFWEKPRDTDAKVTRNLPVSMFCNSCAANLNCLPHFSDFCVGVFWGDSLMHVPLDARNAWNSKIHPDVVKKSVVN